MEAGRRNVAVRCAKSSSNELANAKVAGAANKNRDADMAEGAAAGSVPAAGTSGTASSTGPDYSAILGDIEIPEGVDPSFLAALPEDMRAEVLEEQRRLLRARAAPPNQPCAGCVPGVRARLPCRSWRCPC